jgi:hypothetical protein
MGPVRVLDEARVQRLDAGQAAGPEIGGVFVHGRVKIRPPAYKELWPPIVQELFAITRYEPEHHLDTALEAAGYGLGDMKAIVLSYAAWWRSCRKVKLLAQRTGARLVFGHDADVLAELSREDFYD